MKVIQEEKREEKKKSGSIIEQQFETMIKNVTIENVDGDITDPVGDAPIKVIVNLSDDGGKWGNMGLFGAITKKFGKKIGDGFESKKYQLGQVHSILASETDDTKIYVSTLICQFSSSGHPFDLNSFGKSFNLLINKLKDKEATIHLPMLTQNTNWSKIEEILKTSQIPVYE